MKQPKKVGYMALGDKELIVTEKLNALVDDETIKFPKELGVKHPFNFEDAEKLYKSFGLITGAVNKIADNIVGEFSIKSKDPKIKKIIQDFVKESNMPLELRRWIIEGLVKGNGFLEVDIKDYKLSVVNANNVFVVRDKQGNVKGYNQFLGNNFKNFNIENRNKVISFLPKDMVHLKINQVAGDAYGYGLLMPNERVVENLIQKEQDLTKLIQRKAGAPIHAKVGQPGEVVDTAVVDGIKNNLQYMNNRTEWVTDANVEFKVIEFGDIGKNVTDAIQHDIRMLCAGLQIPEVMLNSGQLNEGIASVQLEGFQRFVASIQEDIEFLVENKILKPFLENQGLSDEIEFTWNLPGEEEINLRLTQLNTLLTNPFLSDGMRQSIQLEIGKLLNFENPEDLVNTPNTQGMTADKNPTFTPEGKLFEPKQDKTDDKKKENERKREEEKPQPTIPGEQAVLTLKEENVNNEKVNVHRHHITEADYGEMTIKEFANLQEISGFRYSDYLINILKKLKVDKFETLKAITEKDIAEGLLTNEQVEKLRQILKDGFRKNKSIREIEEDIANNLALKDRIKEDGAIIPATTRPNMISRTETIRIANAGLLDTYKENNIKNVRWLAALSDRTCDICDSRNGKIMSIEEAYSEIPAHVNCRCTWLSITE